MASLKTPGVDRLCNFCYMLSAKSLAGLDYLIVLLRGKLRASTWS